MIERNCNSFPLIRKIMPYTLKDVAALAGVSIATASRVINGKPGVKPATRTKILDVARELNYLPDQLAKGMKTKRTNTIGLVVADITNPFYSYTAKIIEMKARAHNYTVIVGNTNNNSTIEHDIITNLRERKVDGFIFASVELHDKPVRQLIQSGAPCITYHRHLEGYQGNFIGSDESEGVSLATQHLYDLGHRRIGFISGPRIFSTGRERLRSFLETSRTFAIESPDYLIKEGGYEITKTRTCVNEILSLPEPPTAIFAANDLMALQVLDCVLEAGYRVPDDISIVGYDDIAIASHHSIQLTTVNVHAKQCAELVIETLINIIEGLRPAGEHTKTLLKPELKVRESTAKPRK
jgi:LacI family transcriptional regulator